MAFILQGSLVTGWSDFRSRATDDESLSDVDIQVIVGDTYWQAIQNTAAQEIVYSPLVMTNAMGLENIGKIDPALADLIQSLESVDVAKSQKFQGQRPVHFVLMPASSYQAQQFRQSRIIHQDNINTEKTLKEKEAALTLVNC